MSKERIVIAMSGGVDSSVAAALLVDAGYEVVGISMRLYDADPRETGKGCCSPSDLDDARAAAAQLGIPHYIFDIRESFQKHVIDDFVEEYLVGRTPNPCVRCNQHIKFDALWDKARRLGASHIATGHYARIENDADGNPRLLRGVDSRKDQSYFLFPLGRDHLSRILFPIGHMTKDEVRQIARERGLPNADKPESQEICFVGGGSYVDLVRDKAADRIKKGQIVDESGKVLAAHDGIHQFTVGQRRGLPAGPEKRYVTAIEPDTGLVRLGGDSTLKRREFSCSDVIWTGGTLAETRRATIMIRYKHSGAHGEVQPVGSGVRIVLDEAERAVSPGQAAVFYDGDTVLGGGWIDSFATQPTTTFQA